ncbi:medium-chain acyl-CoA ligase ACSF2, mitochondrial-like [Ptychodera flava]|uniref:medium-chain acyl-CoA ligase ACSF2, mitochondrial-like n=1 Tax=Ptychodera flava TaxID=63121 RepID=UPI00396A8D3B
MLGEGHFPGTYMFDDILDAPSNEHFVEVEELQDELQFDDPINIQFTSGTTGQPKGVCLSHHNILNDAYYVGRSLGYHAEEHIINVPVPLFHSFGATLGSICSMLFGSTVVYPSPAFDPLGTLKAVTNERCTSLYGTTTMFIDVLHHPDFDKYDLSSLRTGVMGASPCPIEIMKQLISKMNIRDINICYGMTETSPVTFQAGQDLPIEIRVSTVGRPIDHTEAKIIDSESGQVVAIETPGELCTRGFTTMLGYWEDEEKTKEVIGQDKWLHTGNIVVYYITLEWQY